MVFVNKAVLNKTPDLPFTFLVMVLPILREPMLTLSLVHSTSHRSPTAPLSRTAFANPYPARSACKIRPAEARPHHRAKALPIPIRRIRRPHFQHPVLSERRCLLLPGGSPFISGFSSRV
jgi:hypothetical protein